MPSNLFHLVSFLLFLLHSWTKLIANWSLLMRSASKCITAHMETASKCIYCEMEKSTQCVNATERVKNETHARVSSPIIFYWIVRNQCEKLPVTFYQHASLLGQPPPRYHALVFSPLNGSQKHSWKPSKSIELEAIVNHLRRYFLGTTYIVISLPDSISPAM